MDNNFKRSFKYYKSKEATFENVLDFNHSIDNLQNEIKKIDMKFDDKYGNNECIICKELGLKSHMTWSIYTLTAHPGFLFLSNIFNQKAHHTWIKKCLEVYPKKPNLTNIDELLEKEQIDDIWHYHINNNSKLIKKLRWATFGYHHNWDTKIYNLQEKSPFPPCLEQLVCHIASILNFKYFRPEASIVNYYDLKSTLSGHVDKSEYDLQSPIFSFSFGQTAIFLLGGESTLIKPTPMFVRSGDLIVMAGLSRNAYHAIPRIIKDDTKDTWLSEDMSEHLKEYLMSSRININVRQVFPSCIEN